jgi:hypothetical protein
MLEQYQLAPKDEDEMEDFRDFDDEHSDLGSKLDEFADEEEDEEELDVWWCTVVKAPEDPMSLVVPPAPAAAPPAKKPVEKATAPEAKPGQGCRQESCAQGYRQKGAGQEGCCS